MSKRLSILLEAPISTPAKKRHLDGTDSLIPTNIRENVSMTNPTLPLSVPLLHTAPKSMLPIIHPPLKVNEFFTDLENDVTNTSTSNQINNIVNNFPPPPIPSHLTPQHMTQGGIMIPFIYPPPPLIKDKYGESDPLYGSNKSKTYIPLPPLPFPPPNYMPYPLISDNSSLTPNEVFKVFLDALTKLPRIDMVVASAAGSLYDMRAQADQEGFTITNHESSKKSSSRKNRRNNNNSNQQTNNNRDGEELEHEDELEDDDSEDEEYDEEYEDYKEYANGVDTSHAWDEYHRQSIPRNTVEIRSRFPPDYMDITPKTSDIKAKRLQRGDKKYPPQEFPVIEGDESIRSLKLPSNLSKIISNLHKDILSASGNHKERRREDLLKSMNEIAEFEASNEEELYLTLKREQLQKLKDLRQSIILFNGSDHEIKDSELLDVKQRLEVERDDELVKLKLFENYQLLNSALVFYQDSNKTYKNMNQLIVNKLMKLKNFFEYQKQLFTKALENESDQSFFDIKSKDSAKLYAGISTKDMNAYIKETIRLQASQTSSSTDSPELTLGSGYVGHSQQQIPLVHDFIPLASEKEFNLITGDLPSNKYKSASGENNSTSGKGKGYNSSKTANMKHHIFQSPLYDPLTSGSDTNSEANSSGAPKRRGRRAAGATNPGPGDKLIDGADKGSLKYSEAVLLAKIMKHYVPPQGARPDELTNDLEGMGVSTKWPVSK